MPGVAHVILFGGAVREIQIQPDLKRMTSYGFTLTDLSDAARAALALRGAGFVDLAHQRVLIQTPVPTPDVGAVRDAVLAVRGKTPITIGQVATVTEAPALRSGDALVMGRKGVLLSLASQYGANTLDTTRAVEATLAQLTPALKAQGITVYPALHRPANFIERALSSLERSLVDRRRADPGGAVPVPARLACGPHHLPRHSAVADGRGGGAEPHGLDPQHHDLGRVCRGAGRSGG